MSDDSMLKCLFEEVGALKERISSLEQDIYSDDEYDPDDTQSYTTHFSYPMLASKVTEATTNHFRVIKNSMYKVYIAKPHFNEQDPDSHTLMEIEMTRDELDSWIAHSPAERNGEYIYKLIPSYDDYL